MKARCERCGKDFEFFESKRRSGTYRCEVCNVIIDVYDWFKCLACKKDKALEWHKIYDCYHGDVNISEIELLSKET